MCGCVQARGHRPIYIYIYIYIYICNPAHRVSRPRGTGSVGDSVGEGTQTDRRTDGQTDRHVPSLGPSGRTMSRLLVSASSIAITVSVSRFALRVYGLGWTLR